ncbi:Glucose--fructose oxidoreductase precursor [Roseimaritima multifibrata]|uniref:Glucose--fructose oxidoreductase n=1 Tax=Roseimaritima multifibrata TaxID=1930274 RepID=A0A517MEN4_9BACT|nr:Gfo/Idh/MocA family oxidoreductase [Roseimaritima multifibrata]QDS93352.1 Glucose--fructose oxidoreductase precursor [Roseimaritima multifibrata]
MDKLSPEQREVGQGNYYRAVDSYFENGPDVERRDFLKGVVGAGLMTAGGMGAAYFGYKKVADPVRVAVIGTGDEGNVLIGGCNPDYVTVKAICDIRPFSLHRAFEGDWSTPSARGRRPGLMDVYGYKTRTEAEKQIKVYDSTNGGIQACLDDPNIEAVIIALPLWLHAGVAAQAMNRGLHVLTEKLMAHNVAQCKAMGRMSYELKDKQGNPLHLATGHQRHYNIKYDNAVNLIRWGLLGQLHHIRAQWHRGNAPGGDSWKMPLPGGETTVNGGVYDKIVGDLKNRQGKLAALMDPKNRSQDFDQIHELQQQIAYFEAWDMDKYVDPADYGYMNYNLGDYAVTPMEELHRWRLFNRTGGGLMAELGSHQLDAVSIFLSSLRNDDKKVHPLAVHAVGGRHIMPQDRDADDHVYCMFEFPGPEYAESFDVGYKDRVLNYPNGPVPSYEEDPNKKVVVTYSTINGNGFGGWGEVVMGTKGTLILDKEVDVLLYRDSNPSAKVGVVKKDGSAVLDTSASGDFAAPVSQVAESGPVSRGYQEEIEHWAYCIRNPDPANRPRCYPEVAMGDAVIALGTNVALENAAKGKGGYLQFKEEWFELDNDATPDGSVVAEEMKAIQKPVA